MVLSNKDRAKNARLRKKKYYEDLESQVRLLTKENITLKAELAEWKQKILDFHNESNQNLHRIKNSEIPNRSSITAKYDKNEKSSTFQGEIRQLTSNNNSFQNDVSNIKLLDSCFQTIIENAMTENLKLILYCWDKPIPLKKSEYDRYSVMKKFEKFENYPDEHIRTFIDHNISHKLKTYHYNYLEWNIYPILKNLKNSLKDGLNSLFEAQNTIIQTRMKLEMLDRELLEILYGSDSSNLAIKSSLSVENVCDVTKNTVQLCQSLDIHDPLLYGKVLKKYKKSTAPSWKFQKSSIESSYSLTMQKCC